MNTYIHGYSEKELKRLQDQANTLDELFSKITGKPPNMTRSIVKTYYGADQSCNISKAGRELGYNPRSPEETLKESLIYLAEREGL